MGAIGCGSVGPGEGERLLNGPQTTSRGYRDLSEPRHDRTVNRPRNRWRRAPIETGAARDPSWGDVKVRNRLLHVAGSGMRRSAVHGDDLPGDVGGGR